MERRQPVREREREREVASVHLPSRTQAEAASVHLPSRTQPEAASAVSLQQPRPHVQRAANEYVETPLRAAKAPPLPLPPTRHHPHQHHGTRVVVKQPHKDGAVSRGAGAGPSAGDSDCSIICAECGKCRCEACRQPRRVPSLWLCDNFCLCSSETAVDYASCLCCVKAALYHCGSKDDDYDDDSSCSVDDPCSCSPHRRTSRWACLALASVLLPCLCCYWPLRGCSRLVESCYSACSHRGCRCSPAPPAAPHNTASTPLSTSTSSEKRLLRPPTDY
ncbi:protein sprouty [Nilaparvata lugens]|uniref:protein sprouty n=1 Tax=Nilaparvata lugens TaxID=108931 RepID=UPI00193CDABA|nr:protein sprouty [Nilaparvata lugens]XP_039280301.1 protein sprouty [Nilaparvata lugens]